MQKIVINSCFGGFGLSETAIRWLRANSEFLWDTLPGEEYPDGSGISGHWGSYDLNSKLCPSKTEDIRAHPLLVKCIKVLKNRANGNCAQLKIVKIPDDVEWTIVEHDGLEHVAEVHRTWR